MKNKTEITELVQNAVNLLDECVKHHLVPFIQFTEKGQIIRLVDFANDDTEDSFPVLAEYEWINYYRTIASKVNHPESISLFDRISPETIVY